MHRLRHAARTKSFNNPLDGEVEVDETCVGGKATNKPKSKRTGKRGIVDKASVVGAVSRGGDMVARVVSGTNAKTLNSFVRETVSKAATLLSTDDHGGYIGLSKSYPHKVVRHSKGEYVVGSVHTQTIDGYWSQLKRQIIGIHHWVSRKQLSRYVDESSWRYNQRKAGEGDRVNNLLAIVRAG